MMGDNDSRSASKLSASVEADFVKAEKATHNVVMQTRPIMFATMAAAIVIGLGFVMILSRNITRPLRQLTERKKTEEERLILERRIQHTQKIESLGVIAGGIAHDFNNILSGLIGYLELTKDSIDPGSESHEFLSEAETASFRARDLVSQILAFSRQGDQVRKPIMIQNILRETMKLLRNTIPTSIEIDLNISDDCGIVLADGIQIHQVIMNLCTNAYQAMLENGGTWVVQLEETPVDGEAAAGEGLNEGQYARLIRRLRSRHR